LVLKAIIFLELFEFFVSRGLKWSGTILVEIFFLPGRAGALNSGGGGGLSSGCGSGGGGWRDKKGF